MTYKQVKKYGFRDGLSEGDPEKVIYGQDFDGEFEAIEKAFEAIDPNTDGNVDINEIDGLQDALDNKADKDHTHDEYLTDAPNDGKQYVRESEAWAEVTIPEAGISEPTPDGKPYSRQVEGGQTVGVWVEAPTAEDIEYLDGRIDSIEGNISSGGGFIEAPNDGDDYARNGQSPAWVKTYNAEYIDALEADYKNADSGKADKVHNHAISDVTGLQTALDGKADTGHNHDSDYAPISHTHTTDEITGLDDKIIEIEGDITDLEGAVGELTGQLALGGSYDASTGLVVTANLSSFTAGQPLPDYSTVSNTFVIVTVAGNNPEALGEGDWLVAGQSGWVAIKYGTAGSVDWDNISNVPDFDLVYAPIDHTHEIADVDGLQDALDAAGESLWTQNGDDIYYNDGKVGIGTDNPQQALHVYTGDSTNTPVVIENSGANALGAQINFKNQHSSSLYVGLSGDDKGDYICYNAHPSGSALFSTNSTERMRIDANGNVMSVTSSSRPAEFGGDPGFAVRGDGVKGQIQNTALDGTAAIVNRNGTAGDVFEWRYQGSTLGVFDSQGRVGIGTDNPEQLIHINSDTTWAHSRWSGAGGGSLDIKHYNNTDDNGGIIEMVGGGPLRMFTGNSESMRIDSNGNVQMGATSPATIRTFDIYNTGADASSSSVIRFITQEAGSTATTSGDIVKRKGGEFSLVNNETSADAFISFGIGGSERARIDSNGRVGIGGDPGTRAIDEAKALAKTKLTEWKAEVKKRTAEQPGASTQEITLEVTDGDFGVMPTEQALAEFLQERAVGGGDAKLQVAGGVYTTNELTVKDGQGVGGNSIYTDYRLFHQNGTSGSGIAFGSTLAPRSVVSCNSDGSLASGVHDLGHASYKWKDAHFSGTIYGTVADVPAHVKAITPTQIANWDAGTGGGGGATTDGRISDTQITNWDTAYGWGNHASAGYAKGSFVPTSGNSTISGVLTATDFVASSDERLKDDISPMPIGLIDDIKPVQWTWKDSGKKSAGVIAQQLQEIGLDDFVTEGEDGMLGVNYNALVSVLLAEVISLKKELAK